LHPPKRKRPGKYRISLAAVTMPCNHFVLVCNMQFKIGVNARPEKEIPEFGGYRPDSPPQDARCRRRQDAVLREIFPQALEERLKYVAP
jgi:hypothetical protein